jgi:hypothetical protein
MNWEYDGDDGRAGKDTTRFTLLHTRTDPATHEGWPYPNEYVTSQITGTLADRIRRRFGEPGGTSVLIEETRISGGWSEFTQETSYEFEVRCGEHRYGFTQYNGYDNGLKGLLDWLGPEAEEDGALVDRVADVILALAVQEGREGDVVTSADRDSESYWHCQQAAQEILRMIGEGE